MKINKNLLKRISILFIFSVFVLGCSSSKGTDDIETQVKDAMYNILKNSPSLSIVDKAVEKDLYTHMTLITKIDGEVFPTLTTEEPFIYQVGAQEIVEGFDKNIMGAKAGDTKTFDVKLADDFQDAELAGKTLSFTVNISKVLNGSVVEPIEVDKAAENGSIARINYSGSVAGEKFEGGTSQAPFDLVLGSGSFIDGFEEQIVGKKAGENFTITVTFPAEYQDETLAGKEAEFEVELISVLELPELTDELVASFFLPYNLDTVQKLEEWLTNEFVNAEKAKENQESK